MNEKHDIQNEAAKCLARLQKRGVSSEYLNIVASGKFRTVRPRRIQSITRITRRN